MNNINKIKILPSSDPKKKTGNPEGYLFPSKSKE
jgi:hypothetical protein